MFPDFYHIVANVVWFIQTSVSLWHLYRIGKIHPIRNKHAWNIFPSSIEQTKWMLLSHSIFYGFELIATNMVVDFHSMAIHHVVSLLIFHHMYRNPGSVSVTSLIPFLLHHIYWALGAQYDSILYIYNGYFFFLGLFELHKKKGMIIFLPIMAIILPLVNYYSYCVIYKGYVCFNKNKNDNVIICIIVLFMCCVTRLIPSWYNYRYKVSRLCHRKEQHIPIDIDIEKHTNASSTNSLLPFHYTHIPRTGLGR